MTFQVFADSFQNSFLRGFMADGTHLINPFGVPGQLKDCDTKHRCLYLITCASPSQLIYMSFITALAITPAD